MRQIRRHYGSKGLTKRTIMEWYHRHPRLFWASIGVIISILLVQFLYPTNRALPFTRLAGDAVGLSSDQAIATKLQNDYAGTTVTTTIRDTTTKTSLVKSGLMTDSKRILDGLDSYPWYYRLIPLSLVVRGISIDQPVVTTIDTARFSLYADERVKECSVLPKNAGVIVRDSQVQLDPAKDGQTCSKDSLQKQLLAKKLDKTGIRATIATTAVKPERSNADVQPLLSRAKTVADHQLTLLVAGKTYAVDKATRTSWLAFPEDPKTKQSNVGLNSDAVKKYLDSIQKDSYIAPGATVITTMDSIETARTVGQNGQGIDMNATIEAIGKQFLAEDGVVYAKLTVLSPIVRYDRSYSKTPAGLQALLNDIVRDKGNFAISVRRLNDPGVNTNGDKQYHPASTYKLFVAYSTLKRIDNGQLTWGQTTSGGQTLGQCFDNMIVNSDNACAEWFGQTIGWTTVTNEARALGARNTTLNRPFVSTTNDMALFLQKLEMSQLGLSDASRTHLLDVMKRQVYRQGIPAGVKVTVADKVGFLDGLLHDAAIVYGPTGTYVVVIYSDGSSWAQIADAARQINAQLQ